MSRQRSSERNDALIAAVREVRNVSRVAERFGISRECARKIVARHEFETGDILPRDPRGRPRGEKKIEVKIRIKESLRCLIEADAKARGMTMLNVIVEHLTAASTGYIKPPDPDIAADYWVTRRSADAAPGYDLGLPDIRARYRWNGRDAWVTGYHEGPQRREADLSCLHSNNGWRIERCA